MNNMAHRFFSHPARRPGWDVLVCVFLLLGNTLLIYGGFYE